MLEREYLAGVNGVESVLLRRRSESMPDRAFLAGVESVLGRGELFINGVIDIGAATRISDEEVEELFEVARCTNASSVSFRRRE